VKAIDLFDQRPSFLCTFYYSLGFHIIIIALLLSIPLRSGGVGPALAKRFSISLNTEERTLKTGQSRKVAPTKAANPPETSGKETDDTEGLEEITGPIANTEKSAPSDQGGAELKFAEVSEQHELLTAASPVETARTMVLEGKDDKLQTADKEKLPPKPLEREESPVRSDKPDMKPLVPLPVRASAGPDREHSPKEIPAEKQPSVTAGRIAVPHGEIKRSPADSSNQRPAQEIISPSSALPQIEKQGITLMEDSPAQPLRKEENLTDKKEKAAEKPVMPAADTAGHNVVQEKNSPASPLISQNAQPESAPAVRAVGELLSPAIEGKMAMPPPPASEVSAENVAPAPTTMAAVQSVTDLNNHPSAEKQYEQTPAQKITSVDLTASHETSSKAVINQGIIEATPSLKTRSDHMGTTKVITPTSDKSHEKTLPLPGASEDKTKPVSVPHPEGPAKIEASAKPESSPSSLGLKTDNKGPEAEKAGNRVPDAAPAAPVHFGKPHTLQKSHERGLEKSSGDIIAPTPEMPGKALHIESDSKNAPGVTATKAALEETAPSAPATSEMPALLPSADKKLPLLPMPYPGTLRPADVTARQDTAIPGIAGQTGKDLQEPATPVRGNEMQSENTARLGMPLPEVLFFKDIQIEIYLKGSGIPSVFTLFTKKPYPLPSRKTVIAREEAVESATNTNIRGLDTPGIKHTISVARAEKGRYSFAIENRGKDGYEADILFHFFERKEKEKIKEYRKVQLPAGAIIRFRFVLPDAVFWDDDVFSAEIEDSNYITKVQSESGLVWREEKEPLTSEKTLSSDAQQIPVLFMPK